MKFMVTWQVHEGLLHEVLANFAKMTPEQDKALMGDRVTMVGRWHDLASGCGVAIFESDSNAALSAYALNWNPYMDIEITPVTDDAEARTLGASLHEAP